MLQEHSFFSRPFVFFGHLQQSEKENEVEEEWDFSDPWQIAVDAKVASQMQQKVGLFLHWSEFSE